MDGGTELTDTTQFQRNLRRARTRLGLSQRELAVLSGSAQRKRTISRWENGKTSPQSGSVIREVAAALDFTVEQLMGRVAIDWEALPVLSWEQTIALRERIRLREEQADRLGPTRPEEE